MDIYDFPPPNPRDHLMDRATIVRLIAWGESAAEWVETWEIKPTETYFSNKSRQYTVTCTESNGGRGPRVVDAVRFSPPNDRRVGCPQLNSVIGAEK
jgi:hypothetical protein